MSVDADIGQAAARILVSVIVPVYQAEAYVYQCVSSILEQTHSNIEAILVNDGSKDSSGNILDGLAAKDSRITVIHQENKGVSEARNAGLKLAKGQYITFVDADDWLSPYFVEIFLHVALEHDADFLLSRNTLPAPVSGAPRLGEVQVWSREKAVAELFYAEIKIGCWNKLYKRSAIFDRNIRFDPRFFMGEGLGFIAKVAWSSTKIISLDTELYHYRRDNSDSATSRVSIRKMKNALAAIDSVNSSLSAVDASAQVAIDFHRWYTAFFSLVAFRDEGSPFAERPFFQECLTYVRKNSLRLLVSARISRLRQILVSACLLSPNLAVWAYKARRDYDRSQ